MDQQQNEEFRKENQYKNIKQAKWAAWLLTAAGVFILAESVYTRIKTDEFSIAILAPGLICLLVGASQFRKLRMLKQE